ncbi:MAG: FAD:protein FMN transferase [Pirellulaceae bacterium]
MPEPSKSTRREFLTGHSAVEALGDAVIGSPPPLAPPAAQSGGHSYLLSVSRDAMACEFEVLLDARQHPAAADAAIAALDLVEQLEAQLTVYRESSEISAINRRAAGEAVEVEPQLFDLLVRGRDLFVETAGAFDISAGPLSKVWGFYRRQGQMPSHEEVTATLALVGSDKLGFDLERRTIRFPQPGMELNLGAIGKGFALDRAAQMLLDVGVEHFVIHGGNSSVIARGYRAHSALEAGWSVGLRHPLKPEVRLAEFRLQNQALGTSGSGSQFFHYRGRRYGHILDPRSGWPAERVLSATVVAPTAEQADALSTALYVLGLDGARAFCSSRPEIAALLVTTSERTGTTQLHPLNLADDAWQRL